jgi:hypothetical protein
MAFVVNLSVKINKNNYVTQNAKEVIKKMLRFDLDYKLTTWKQNK